MARCVKVVGFFYKDQKFEVNSPGSRRGGGYFLVKDYWGCAAGWGRIFTIGLTIIGWGFSEASSTYPAKPDPSTPPGGILLNGTFSYNDNNSVQASYIQVEIFHFALQLCARRALSRQLKINQNSWNTFDIQPKLLNFTFKKNTVLVIFSILIFQGVVLLRSAAPAVIAVSDIDHITGAKT